MYFNDKHGTRMVNPSKGQMVRVKSGRLVAKRESKFSEPKKIVKVMKNTVELEDDSIFHMNRLAPVKRVPLTQHDEIQHDEVYPCIKKYWWLDVNQEQDKNLPNNIEMMNTV